MNRIKFILLQLINFFSSNYHIYINFNKSFFCNQNINLKKNCQVALVELHSNYPLVFFWSFICNYLIKEKKIKVVYFYSPIFESYISNILEKFFLKKIYNSFNVFQSDIFQSGSSKNKFYYRNIFKKKIKSKFNLLNYRKNNILIGDLIYDSYLRKYFVPTVFDLKSKNLIDEFVKANIFFDKIFIFFKNNHVKYVLASHVFYWQQGLFYRIGGFFKANLIKVFETGVGYENYRLSFLDKKKPLNFPPYYNYKKIFLNNVKNKKKALIIGKKIIERRLSGKLDSNVGFMKVSSYSKSKNIKAKSIFNKNNKIKVVLFSHCFFDAPHRFRYMLFYDFYDFVLSTINFITPLDNFELYIKPHPFGMEANEKYYLDLLKKFKSHKNIFFMKADISNTDIVNSNPDLVLTCHGNIAHEMAYQKIPTINAGDNLHINYNFNLHPKSQKEYFSMILNYKHFVKKINYQKKNIYEFMFMNSHYFATQNYKNKLIPDKIFFDKFSKKNKPKDHVDLGLLKNYSNYNKKIYKNIIIYVRECLKKL